MVRLAFVRKRIFKWRRDRAAGRIIRNGKRLDTLRWERASTDNEAMYLDMQMRQLEICIERDKDFIRKTAKEVT